MRKVPGGASADDLRRQFPDGAEKFSRLPAGGAARPAVIVALLRGHRARKFSSTGRGRARGDRAPRPLTSAEAAACCKPPAGPSYSRDRPAAGNYLIQERHDSVTRAAARGPVDRRRNGTISKIPGAGRRGRAARAGAPGRPRWPKRKASALGRPQKSPRHPGSPAGPHDEGDRGNCVVFSPRFRRRDRRRRPVRMGGSRVQGAESASGPQPTLPHPSSCARPSLRGGETCALGARSAPHLLQFIQTEATPNPEVRSFLVPDREWSWTEGGNADFPATRGRRSRSQPWPAERCSPSDGRHPRLLRHEFLKPSANGPETPTTLGGANPSTQRRRSWAALIDHLHLRGPAALWFARRGRFPPAAFDEGVYEGENRPRLSSADEIQGTCWTPAFRRPWPRTAAKSLVSTASTRRPASYYLKTCAARRTSSSPKEGSAKFF